MKNLNAQEGKTTAVIAYITFIGAIVAVFMNQDSKNQFAAFHIRQAIGLHLLYFLFVFLVTGFNSWWITGAFWVAAFALWVYGFIGALQEQKMLIPIFGEYFQKWFKVLTE